MPALEAQGINIIIAIGDDYIVRRTHPFVIAAAHIQMVG
jgi:hypothetical protein